MLKTQNENITFWGVRLFWRIAKDARRKNKKNELTSKNRNSSKIKNMFFSFFRWHFGPMGGRCRSIHVSWILDFTRNECKSVIFFNNLRFSKLAHFVYFCEAHFLQLLKNGVPNKLVVCVFVFLFCFMCFKLYFEFILSLF